MKKFLSLFLSVVMVLSLGVVVFAEDYSTDVSYTGEYTDASTGEHTEYFEVTVPADMTPGETKEVLAEGTWPSTRTLSVTAPSSVTLTNDIDSDTKVLDVTFAGISLDGSNTVEVSTTEEISVADISNALFGTWEGTITYTVAINDIEPELITFSIDGISLTAESGMTWGEWVESDYNTIGVSFNGGNLWYNSKTVVVSQYAAYGLNESASIIAGNRYVLYPTE